MPLKKNFRRGENKYELRSSAGISCTETLTLTIPATSERHQ